MGRYIQDGQLNITRMVMDAGIALGALIVLLICWPFYSVPTGSRGVVTQFGKIVGIEGEGLAVLPPWRKLSNFSVRAEKAAIEKAEGATSDTQPVHTSLTIRYSIKPDMVAEVFEKYSHDGDLSTYIQTGGLEVFKAVTAKYTAVDLIAKRAVVSNDIYSAMQAKVDKYGAAIINIDMTNFAFEKAYMDAINAKSNQDQLLQAADKKLKTVESEQKQKVAIAEAEATAIKAKADGDAYATITNAKAEAAATEVTGRAKAVAMEVQARALTNSEKLVALTQAEKWNGALPTAIYAGAPIPFLNIGK